MFFFFVGGVEEQVRQVLKYGAGGCISCGSKADLVDYEKVLKLFFLPVWKWPGKDPMMYCDNCKLFFPPSYSLPPQTADSPPQTADSPPPPPSSAPVSLRCRFCDRLVEPDFRFCPFCGSAL